MVGELEREKDMYVRKSIIKETMLFYTLTQPWLQTKGCPDKTLHLCKSRDVVTAVSAETLAF